MRLWRLQKPLDELNDMEAFSKLWYEALRDRSFKAVAVCMVDGGPEYEVSLKGTAAPCKYSLDRNDLDFGDIPFTEVGESEIYLSNRGQVAASFNFNLAGISRPFVVDVVPNNGILKPEERLKVVVRFRAGIPDLVVETVLVEVAHFEPVTLTVRAGVLQERAPDVVLQFADVSVTLDDSGLPKLEAIVESLVNSVTWKCLIDHWQKGKHFVLPFDVTARDGYVGPMGRSTLGLRVAYVQAYVEAMRGYLRLPAGLSVGLRVGYRQAYPPTGRLPVGLPAGLRVGDRTRETTKAPVKLPTASLPVGLRIGLRPGLPVAYLHAYGQAYRPIRVGLRVGCPWPFDTFTGRPHEGLRIGLRVGCRRLYRQAYA
ncbi:Hydin [Symbiodinium natans]|uniref:Hydin protein n=1 Tax=Symbiodinium natans TaxID=878477 RepID=A0A812G6C8_9DINO|nr:Hydin [Symbiodinium natans]